VAAKIRKAVAHIADPCLAIYGVTYKPDVNDQRESPAWKVVELLRQDGYRLDIYDPVAGPKPKGNPIAFAKGHDALVVLVEHSEIVDLLANAGSSQILGALAQPIILRF
jgi:UDP-N-acetyl-D-mannosaminuronate dehydrogenase